MSGSDILKVIEGNIDDIRASKVRRLGLFGSAVRGGLGPKSDLDFVVEFSETSFDNYMDLKFLLEDLLDRNVDLVIADCIKPSLSRRILGETVYAEGL